MCGLTDEDIVEKIIKEKGISKEEIDEKVDEKIKQLSDLISKEGAAQIIANQMGVRVLESVADKKFKINEFIPIEISSSKLTKKRRIDEVMNTLKK